MSQTTINTPSGPIIALTTGNCIHARGIPYAIAPRFSPPLPITTTTHARPLDCTTPAPLCPQLPSRLDTVLGPLTTGHAFSETCLHLSITAPNPATTPNNVSNTTPKPVLVFLHGGAYISGGGDLPAYQPLALAARNIVTVTITYRLGVFGYLALPGIAPANLGLLDQRAALRWIQTNIASFGGDPHNVTLAGQSAGADSIICLLAAEGTEGLFHRAILLSPPLREIRERTENDTATLLSRRAGQILSDPEVGSDVDPRALSVDDLLALQRRLLVDNPVRNQVMLFAPALGTYPLPGLEEKKGFDAALAERVRDVPVLIGWTTHDGRPFSRLLSHWLRGLMGVPGLGRWVEALRTWWITRRYFAGPSRAFHEFVQRAGGRSTTYEFSWRARGNRLGACHCIDLPFVLGSWEAWRGAPMLEGRDSQEEVERVGEAVKDLWTGFISGRVLKGDHISIGRGFTSTQGLFVE